MRGYVRLCEGGVRWCEVMSCCVVGWRRGGGEGEEGRGEGRRGEGRIGSSSFVCFFVPDGVGWLDI